MTKKRGRSVDDRSGRRAMRLAEDGKISFYTEKRMRMLLDRVADDAHRYGEGEIDWAEFGATVRVFGELLRQAGEFLEQPRKRLLQLIAAEERGEDEWDPLAPLEELSEDLEHSESLAEAVGSLTECAQEAGRLDLARPAAEWSALVVAHLPSANLGGFLRAAMGSAGTVEELDHWTQHLTDIWNNTPQPDREGKTARQLFAEGERGPA